MQKINHLKYTYGISLMIGYILVVSNIYIMAIFSIENESYLIDFHYIFSIILGLIYINLALKIKKNTICPEGEYLIPKKNLILARKSNLLIIILSIFLAGLHILNFFIDDKIAIIAFMLNVYLIYTSFKLNAEIKEELKDPRSSENLYNVFKPGESISHKRILFWVVGIILSLIILISIFAVVSHNLGESRDNHYSDTFKSSVLDLNKTDSNILGLWVSNNDLLYENKEIFLYMYENCSMDEEGYDGSFSLSSEYQYGCNTGFWNFDSTLKEVSMSSVYQDFECNMIEIEKMRLIFDGDNLFLEDVNNSIIFQRSQVGSNWDIQAVEI